MGLSCSSLCAPDAETPGSVTSLRPALQRFVTEAFELNVSHRGVASLRRHIQDKLEDMVEDGDFDGLFLCSRVGSTHLDPHHHHTHTRTPPSLPLFASLLCAIASVNIDCAGLFLRREINPGNYPKKRYASTC